MRIPALPSNGTASPAFLYFDRSLQRIGGFAKPLAGPSTAARPRPPAARRRADGHLVDVAVLAALDAEHLAGRGSRIGGYSGIDPREVVEHADRADGLVDDVAAVGDFELLRERAHIAGIARGVAGAGVDAAFEPGAGRAVQHRERRITPVVEVGVRGRLDDRS